jgi:cell division protein ZapE
MRINIFLSIENDCLQLNLNWGSLMRTTMLLDYYTGQCRKGLITEDNNQLLALEHFQRVYDDLNVKHQKRLKMLAFLHKQKSVKGLYIWGGIGAGKTFLMDCFYQCVPYPEKMRVHFHQFMRFIHEELQQHQGEKNPLDGIAKMLAKKTLFLCFDEFLVTDITDAMLVGRLLQALFAEGVCLIATSNVPPDDLYKDGLARAQFLPAIAMIKEYTTVFHLATTQDYRLRHFKNAGVFFIPNDESARANMEKIFTMLGDNKQISCAPIEMYGRIIPIKKATAETIWFDFDVICRVPRSQQDYLAIAAKYKTVFISDIPSIPPDAKDTISLFIRMVDIFYDARLRLIFSAAEPIEKIYSRGYLILEYARTQSRLFEMQSEDYFGNENGKTAPT